MELILILVSTLIAPAILLVMNKKIKETHQQVSVNHHSSENPTVLDLLGTLIEEQRLTNYKLDKHLEWHRNRKR